MGRRKKKDSNYEIAQQEEKQQDEEQQQEQETQGEERRIYDAMVDGEIQKMEMIDGILYPISSKNVVDKTKPRKFRLTLIPRNKRNRPVVKRHTISAGPDGPDLRFYQGNVEGDTRDPSKENIIEVSDPKLIRALVSQPETFEEVIEEVAS